MNKNAQCRIESAATLTPQPTRIIDGGTVALRASFSCGLTPAQLGKDVITLRLSGLKPEQFERVVQLLTNLKTAGAEAALGIIEELRGLENG